MVDSARLRDVLARLEDRLDRLAPYGERAPIEFLGDEEGVAASKYYLLTAIEDALAIANHVIASEGFRGPTDYADSFSVMAEEAIVDPELSRRLEAMARFRNLLVHGYAKVDDARVHEFLRSDLEDLRAFMRAILNAFGEV